MYKNIYYFFTILIFSLLFKNMNTKNTTSIKYHCVRELNKYHNLNLNVKETLIKNKKAFNIARLNGSIYFKLKFHGGNGVFAIIHSRYDHLEI